MNSVEHSQNTGATAAVVATTQRIETYPIEFTGSGSEYFRVWIVNVLLTLVTLGIYSPWAKVRTIKYFYSNTLVAGHSFDFHGEPRKMFRGMALVGVFFLIYSWALDFSGFAALVALGAFLVLAPTLLMSAMRFRLANTSWRGLRFHFLGDKKGAYQTLLPPLVLLLLPTTLMAFAGGTDTEEVNAAAESFLGLFGLSYLLLLAALPYFLWRLKGYQHNHFAYGGLRSELRAGARSFYMMALGALGVALLGLIALGLVAVVLVPYSAWSGSAGGALRSVFWALVPLIFIGIIYFNIVPRAFWQARLQNLVWSRTGNNYFRFKSSLPVGAYIWLQFKNYLLILVTLGFYWPFAVVATKRAKLEAITLQSRADLDALADHAARKQAEAAGDAAADMFDLDIGI
jgi:uncharacterized membrane protein YjgN (DUF898 family)